MRNDGNPVIINTDHLAAPVPSGSLWENRAAAYRMYEAPDVPACTIAVLAYNRLHKTRYCVECILNYTKDVDYELLLIDNGSEDETLSYFDSVGYDKKSIVRITKNIGSGYAWRVARDKFSGKYLVIVSNDVYVTKNWLSNLLLCYESDPRIGFVEPVSSNVSNLQQVNLAYRGYDEMQAAASVYNQSDPLKWEERMRLISLIGVYSRPVLDIVGINDAAYLHDFTEDDLAARLRRSGYKLLLCRDTWVCHDHDFSNPDEKDIAALRASLDYGRAVYREKYHGLDAWDDILNFESQLLEPLQTHEFSSGIPEILVSDCRCGTPVLEIRNHLRRRGILGVKSHAFTTQAKYFADLQAVADSVQCDRIERIETHYNSGTFDLAVLCEPVNFYSDPAAVIKGVVRLLKPGGLLLYKLRDNKDVTDYVFKMLKEGPA